MSIFFFVRFPFFSKFFLLRGDYDAYYDNDLIGEAKCLPAMVGFTVRHKPSNQLVNNPINFFQHESWKSRSYVESNGKIDYSQAVGYGHEAGLKMAAT